MDRGGNPLHLDIFHALWKLYHDAGCRVRPAGTPTKGEKETASRKEALEAHPI